MATAPPALGSASVLAPNSQPLQLVPPYRWQEFIENLVKAPGHHAPRPRLELCWPGTDLGALVPLEEPGDPAASPRCWMWPRDTDTARTLGTEWGSPRLCTPRATSVGDAPVTLLASHVRADGLIICTQPFNYPVMATGY